MSAPSTSSDFLEWWTCKAALRHYPKTVRFEN